MLSGEWLVVHLVTKQGLRVQRGRHVQRLIVIVGAFDGDESGCRIGANHLQEIRKSRPSEAADGVPSLHADMARVLPHPGKRLNLRQRVVSGLLHRTGHGKSPLFEIDSGICHVIAIDGKFLKRNYFGVGKGSGQMPGAKQSSGSPIAEAQAGLQQRLLKFRNRERADGKYWRKLQQFAARDLLELAGIDMGFHGDPCSAGIPPAVRRAPRPPPPESISLSANGIPGAGKSYNTKETGKGVA